MTLLIILIALFLDWILGEPKRWHPLVGFGRFSQRVEAYFYPNNKHHNSLLMYGLFAWIVAVIPLTFASFFLTNIPFVGDIISVFILYLCIGHKSLYDHVTPIINALVKDDEDKAKLYTSYIVSRDREAIHVPKATIESILENGSDAIFAALFWFIVAGVPGVVLYRLSNTLDATWGYKNDRYLYFGRVAARIDDLLNFIPARLTALSYAIMGKTRQALSCWRNQAPTWDSPNAGPVMAAGAGALDIELGGLARYHGVWHDRPILGLNGEAQAADIPRALDLVTDSVFLWVLVITVVSGVMYV